MVKTLEKEVSDTKQLKIDALLHRDRVATESINFHEGKISKQRRVIAMKDIAKTLAAIGIGVMAGLAGQEYGPNTGIAVGAMGFGALYVVDGMARGIGLGRKVNYEHIAWEKRVVSGIEADRQKLSNELQSLNYRN